MLSCPSQGKLKVIVKSPSGTSQLNFNFTMYNWPCNIFSQYKIENKITMFYSQSYPAHSAHSHTAIEFFLCYVCAVDILCWNYPDKISIVLLTVLSHCEHYHLSCLRYLDTWMWSSVIMSLSSNNVVFQILALKLH